MIVEELIQRLQQLDPYLEVRPIFSDNQGFGRDWPEHMEAVSMFEVLDVQRRDTSRDRSLVYLTATILMKHK